MGITLYTHRCPECGLTYRVALNRTRHTLLRTRCPDCKSKSYFDNTDGSLEFLPRKRRLSFAIRQYDLIEGRDFEKERDEPPARTVEEAIQRHARKTRRVFGSQENEDGYLLVGLTGSQSKPRKPRVPVHRQEGNGHVQPRRREGMPETQEQAKTSIPAPGNDPATPSSPPSVSSAPAARANPTSPDPGKPRTPNSSGSSSTPVEAKVPPAAPPPQSVSPAPVRPDAPASMPAARKESREKGERRPDPKLDRKPELPDQVLHRKPSSEKSLPAKEKPAVRPGQTGSDDSTVAGKLPGTARNAEPQRTSPEPASKRPVPGPTRPPAESGNGRGADVTGKTAVPKPAPTPPANRPSATDPAADRPVADRPERGRSPEKPAEKERPREGGETTSAPGRAAAVRTTADDRPVPLKPVAAGTAGDGSDIPVVQATNVIWQNPDMERAPGEKTGAFLWRTIKETALAFARLPRELFTSFTEIVRLPGDLIHGRRSRREGLTLAGLYLFLFSQVGLLVIFLIFQFPQLVFFQSPDSFLPRLLPVASNRILDRDGRLLGELFARKTSNLSLDRVPPTLVEKLIFVEDEHFYEHDGIRWSSIGRAVLRNTMARGFVEGGSTLTQQLARIVLRRRDRTLLRKFREAVMATYLERKLTKEEILGAYINHVYMGHGANGMQVAGEFYFNRPLEKLNFVEELMLVALLPAPEKLSPLHNPRLLSRRLDLLYERMSREGFTAVTPGIYQVQKRRLFQKFNRSPNENVFAVRFNEAPYVSEYVRLLIKKVLGEEWQYDSSLTIHTTIDGRLQKTAREEAVRYINKIGKRFPPRRIVPLGPDQNRIKKILTQEYRAASLGGFLMGMPIYRERPPRLQTGAIGILPGTGEVLFMQGGSEFSSSNQLNRAIGIRRQTGSAIKPIVYSAGIERGLITPATQIRDEPLNMGSWEPKNFNQKYSGSVSVRTALKKSLNVPSVRIGMRVGMKGLSNQFQKFFFTDEDVFKKRFRPDYTIAIGSLEMSPLEMAVAFSAFGNNGVIQRPFLVREIKDPTGRVLYSHQQKDEFNMRIPSSHRAIPGDVAQVVASLLKGSAQNGGVSQGGFKGGPLLGKTGTSNDSRDAWFIGIVPNLVAAVWVGYDEAIYVMPGGTGATVAGPLWGRIVSKGMKVGGNFQFSPRARRVTVCRTTGRLARRACPRTYTELFSSSIRPSTRCWKHGGGSAGKDQRKDRKERRERRDRRDRRENRTPVAPPRPNQGPAPEIRRPAPGAENPATPAPKPGPTQTAPPAAPERTPKPLPPAPRPQPRIKPLPPAKPRPTPAPAPSLPPLEGTAPKPAPAVSQLRQNSRLIV